MNVVKMGDRYLVLMRHGESLLNRAERDIERSDFGFGSLDVGLTAKGVRQVEESWLSVRSALGGGLAPLAFTSEARRARDTLSALPVEASSIRCDSRLNERDLGRFGFLTFRERLRLLGGRERFLDQYRFDWSPPGAESVPDVVARVHSFLSSLLEDDERPILAITHYYVLLAARLVLEGVDSEEFSSFMIRNRKIANAQYFRYSFSETLDAIRSFRTR